MWGETKLDCFKKLCLMLIICVHACAFVCVCLYICVSAGECKTKTDEDAIMAKEVSALKAILNTAKPDKTRMREYLVRLMYIDVRIHT